MAPGNPYDPKVLVDVRFAAAKADRGDAGGDGVFASQLFVKAVGAEDVKFVIAASVPSSSHSGDVFYKGFESEGIEDGFVIANLRGGIAVASADNPVFARSEVDARAEVVFAFPAKARAMFGAGTFNVAIMPERIADCAILFPIDIFVIKSKSSTFKEAP